MTKKQRYTTLRVHFYSGSGFLSRAIQWRTFSPISHVSVQVWELIYEALIETGVTISLAKKEPPASVIDTIEIRVRYEDTQEAIKWLKTQINAKYDFWGILGFLVRPKRAETDEKWFCSELVSEFLSRCGVMVLPDRRLSPWELHTMLTVAKYFDKI